MMNNIAPSEENNEAGLVMTGRTHLRGLLVTAGGKLNVNIMSGVIGRALIITT